MNKRQKFFIIKIFFLYSYFMVLIILKKPWYIIKVALDVINLFKAKS